MFLRVAGKRGRGEAGGLTKRWRGRGIKEQKNATMPPWDPGNTQG